MPRARNIKPAFFANEDLAEIEPIGRLLFIGLWTLADRDGRLEDRPKRIKGELFPYDNCDINALLDDLHKYGFILRYEVDGGKYIQIVNFSKHQNPHPKEPSKGFPFPETCEQVVSREKKLQATDKQVAKNADILNPDILNPEYIYSDSDESPSPPPSRAGGCEKEHIPYDEILEHYKQLCPSLPIPSKLNTSRKTQIKARWKNDLHGNFEEMDAFFRRVEASDFLTGRNGARAKPFGIDWIFKEQNFLKIQEGNYDGKSKATPSQFEYPIQQGDETFGTGAAL